MSALDVELELEDALEGVLDVGLCEDDGGCAGRVTTARLRCGK